MKAHDLLELLREFHRDKLAMYQRHVAAARYVSNYDVNNTYQYIIAREDMQVAWLADAILEFVEATRYYAVCRRSQVDSRIRWVDDGPGVAPWNPQNRPCRTGSNASAFCAGPDVCAAG